MVFTIARKELHENAISLRFALLLALSVLLVPASLYTNHRTYLERLSAQQQVESRNREMLRALQVTQVFTNPDFGVDVYWAPAAASVYASGFESSHPRHLVVNRHGVEYGAPLEEQSSAGLFGAIDYLFIVEFIFSLFAILLSFDAITREKERGTLRGVLSNPVSRAGLVTGKLLGGYLSLAIPLLLGFLVGLLMLALSGLHIFGADFLARTAWVLLASLLYVAVFFMLGLLVSTLVSTTHAALMVSLAFWVVAVLVAPRAGSLVSQLLRPVESAQVVWLEKLAAEAAIDAERGRALDGVRKQIEAARGEVTDQNPGEWGRERAAAVVPFDERKRDTLARLDDDHRRRREEQRRLGLGVARLSPAGAMVNFTTSVAGTGLGAEARFVSEAQRYRQALTRELFDRIFVDVFPDGHIRMGMLGTLDLAGLPEFRLPVARVAETVPTLDLAILGLWFAGAGALVYRGMARYDVR
jgi:ABC-type transport system involved in multi-copper enzyme maturation permease subunit